MGSWFEDLMLGARPDMAVPDFMAPFLTDIQNLGDPGPGRVGKADRADFKTARDGRIEEMGRLKPVLSAINANKAASYKTAERSMNQAMAFENQPSLVAAMLSELNGDLDANASQAFAGAAADAYNDTANSIESRNRYRSDRQYQVATDRARLAAGSAYDRNRKGGLLNQWLSPEGIAGAAGLAKSLLPRSAPKVFNSPDNYGNNPLDYERA
jgi:hypothetical protein